VLGEIAGAELLYVAAIVLWLVGVLIVVARKLV